MLVAGPNSIKHPGPLTRVWSYLWPVRLGVLHSLFSGTLMLNMVNGRIELDAAHANYSYGSLQRVLRKGLKHLKHQIIQGPILVLGTGGGSVVPVLRKELKLNSQIHLVDIDPLMHELCTNLYRMSSYAPIKMYTMDAIEFVAECRDTFALVVVDLFIDEKVPKSFLEPVFAGILSRITKKGGSLLFNTMNDTMPKEILHQLLHNLSKAEFSVEVLLDVEGTNTLILGRKA